MPPPSNKFKIIYKMDKKFDKMKMDIIYKQFKIIITKWIVKHAYKEKDAQNVLKEEYQKEDVTSYGKVVLGGVFKSERRLNNNELTVNHIYFVHFTLYKIYTSQSNPSFNPYPWTAEHLNIDQDLFLMEVRPIFSKISSSVNALAWSFKN